MFRPTLDRKRKSTTGLLVIVAVGLLFYFLCSIPDNGGKVVPNRRIISTRYRIGEGGAESSTITSLLLRRSSVVALSEGQAPEPDMIQNEGNPRVHSGDLVDPGWWKDLSMAQAKMLGDGTKLYGLSRAFASRSKLKEPVLRTGELSKNSTLARSSRPESRSIMTSARSRTESRSDAVKIRNSVQRDSDVVELRSNIPKVNSGAQQELDSSQSRPRTDSISRSSTKNRFRFLIDVSGFCDRHTLVLIIVCSAWENGPRREVIRATWASLEDRQLRVLFMVGLPKQDNRTEAYQRALEQESSNRGDLLQADFIDSYANLSLKSIAMLQWTESNCQPARFLVKADDDVLVNTPLLLRDLALTRHHRFVMGNVIAGARPSRDLSSKWFTSPIAYPRDFYPKYISGAAYVISGDLVRDLYAAAIRAEVFWIEDVFITGLLLAATGSDVTNVQHIYNGKFDIQKEFNDPCVLRRHILRHLSDPTDMTALWSVITSPSACVT